MVLAALGMALGLQLPGRRRAAAALLVALASGAIGLGQRSEDAQRQSPGSARTRTLEAGVRSVSRSGGWTVELEDVAGVDGLAPPRVRLSGRSASDAGPGLADAVPGWRVRVRARLRVPRPLRNPGRSGAEARARRAGLGAVGGPAHASLYAHLPQRDGSAFRVALHRWRARVATSLGEGEGAALLRALALGDAAGLRRESRDGFARLGVSHLLAVSGLHLAWVASLAFALVRLGPGRLAGLAARGDVRRLALAGAMLAASGYALIAGWGIPVRRALLLLLVLALAVLAGRARARAEALGLAALVILAFEPGALFAPGAQLSFAATAALLLAVRPAGPQRWVASLLRTSATALVATAPLAALHFGSHAPLALLANLVAVPWTGVVLLPAALASLVAASLPGLPAAGVALALAQRLASATLLAAAWAAERVPGAEASPAPDTSWVLGAAVLGAASLCARGTPARIAGALAVALVLHLAPASELEPAAPRAVFFDVGQGDAILVEGHQGALLVDAGIALEQGPDLGQVAVLPALRALGVRALDLLVASHADLDHRGGLPAVLAALPVGELWLPRGGLAEEAFAGLRAAARARGVPVLERGQGDAPVRFGDLLVAPLWPPRGTGLSRNDRSLVLAVEVAGRRVLLPGDLEAPGERALVASGAELAADLLKLPHHGSRSSSTRPFLAAVGAAVSVASAPCESRFGMPHAEVVARARALGHALWWTGRDGAVLVGLGEPLHASGTGAARSCR